MSMSPAAEGPLGAAEAVFAQAGTTQQGLAAFAEALADEVVPEYESRCVGFTIEAIRLNRMGIRNQILAIAAELRGDAPSTNH